MGDKGDTYRPKRPGNPGNAVQAGATQAGAPAAGGQPLSGGRAAASTTRCSLPPSPRTPSAVSLLRAQ